MRQSDNISFGLKRSLLASPIVLDKSYLQSVGAVGLQYLCQKNVVVVPNVLLLEILSKSDEERDERDRCLKTLRAARENLLMTPAVAG